MIRLVYMSQAVKHFSEDDLMTLLKQSRKCNASNGITGVLLYVNDCFLQILEGKEEKVVETFERIKKDKRHENVNILERSYITESQFPDWSMGFEEIDSSDLADLNIEGLNDFFSNNKQSSDKPLDNNKLVGSLMKHLRERYQKSKQHDDLPVHDDQEGVLQFFHIAIRYAIKFLAGLMVLVIYFGVFDVVYVIYQKFMTPPYFILNITDILDTFGAFMAVLIAIEIFLNISLYLRSDVIPVKLVVATALMAVARKVIVFDYKHLDPSYVYASAAVVLALGLTYWLVQDKSKKEET